LTDANELIKFSGGMTATGRIGGHASWRGSSTATVGEEGIEFALDHGFRLMGHRYVKRVDLARIYPVQPQPMSLSRLIAAIFPRISNIAIRFVTNPVGRYKDCDDYAFYPYWGEAGKLLDLLEELGYPVDRRLRTRRVLWQDEA
jgi:hypothetical protein